MSGTRGCPVGNIGTGIVRSMRSLSHLDAYPCTRTEMKKLCIRNVIFLLVLSHSFLLIPPVKAAEERTVAVTFDDLPIAAAGTKSESMRRKITLRLLQVLVEREIPATGFVNEVGLVIDGEVREERVDLLRLWLASGQDLGNHSYSHPDLHQVSAEEFHRDVLRGDEITRALLAERGKEPRYFRHPYLHTGRSLEVKHNLTAFLETNGYEVAPVTIDNSDWIFARAYDLAILDGDVQLADKVGRDYVEYMLQVIAFYEDQSQQLFGRNIRQVLLVHANQLNSVWFAALADRMLSIGYDFVSLSEVLEDPAYRSADTFVGSGGITWLHRWAITRKVDPKMFRGEPTPPDYVMQLAE
jgi:peptidoglycan/xylan/chitin deacetylase (PgdA/CDA1 family)